MSDLRVSMRETYFSYPNDKMARIKGRIDIFDFPLCHRADLDHFVDIDEMVQNKKAR